jgi:hypothetical protein
MPLVLAIMVPPATEARAPRGFFGVVPQETPTRQDYSAMAAADAGTLRVAFNWASIQQVKGNCQSKARSGVCWWGDMDALIGTAAAYGIRVLPIVSGTPRFVSKRKPNKPPLKGTDLKRWRAFARAAGERYGRRGYFWRRVYRGDSKPITDWQIWNEPNSRQFWSGHPNGRKYAKLVRASERSLRKADRKSDIVLGGMFASALVPAPQYLRQFYGVRRIERHFEEIAIHPYASGMRGLKRQIAKFRRAARKAGDRKVGIRITELGWSSKRGKHPLMVGVQGQKKMVEKSFRLLAKKRKKWNIRGVNWFALRDSNRPDTCRFCHDAGLLNEAGGAKPAYRAFKRHAR